MPSSPPTERNRPEQSNVATSQLLWSGNRDGVERINACMIGMWEFANRRGQRNMDAATRLIEAKSPTEFMLVYIQWVRDAIEDYAGQMGRLTEAVPVVDSAKSRLRREGLSPDSLREHQTELSSAGAGTRGAA